MTSPAEPSIRAYVDAERDAVLRLVGATLGEFGFAANLGAVEADLADVARRYSGRGGFWVAELAGAIVGCVGIRAKEDDGHATCELKRLYVSREVRGRGLGQRLYAHAETFARAAGYARIWLDSSRRFAGARRLYARNGFALLEELDNDWEDNVYEKSLAR